MCFLNIAQGSSGSSSGSPYTLALFTLGGVVLTLIFNEISAIRRRKEQLEDAKIKRVNEIEDHHRTRDSDLHFISTQLIFRLEAFVLRCADVAVDVGEVVVPAAKRQQEERAPMYPLPTIHFDDIEGNWKSLPALVMFMTLELPVLVQEAQQHIATETEYLTRGQDDRHILRLRAEHIAPVGLRAAAIARRLRRNSGFFVAQLDSNDWSPVRVMQKVRRRAVREKIKQVSFDN